MAATLLQRATVQNRGKISSGQIVLRGQWSTVARPRFGRFTSTSSALYVQCQGSESPVVARPIRFPVIKT